MGLLLLIPIIILLVGLLGIAVVEFYAIASGKPPYTVYARGLITHYPAPAVGLAFGLAVFLGWLGWHLFASLN